MSATNLKSFDMVGEVEDVSEDISMLDPHDTPFLSSIKSETIEATDPWWMEDQLRAGTKNAKVQGADFSDTTRDQPVKRYNSTQIIEETFKLAGTTQAIKLHGRRSAVERETMKTGKVLKVDIEVSMVGNGQTRVEALEATAGEFASVQAQIDASVTTAVTGPITEAAIIGLGQKLYVSGGKGSTLMIAPNDAIAIAGFATDRQMSGDSKRITNVVAIYESPFGTVKVVKNRELQRENALMYDASNWRKLVLRDWQREKLAKVGDADRWSTLTEISLKHVNQKASGLLTGLTD